MPAPDLDAAPWPRLTGRGLAQMALFYRAFGALYATTIALTARETQPQAWADYLGRVLRLDYPLKARWTAPVR